MVTECQVLVVGLNPKARGGVLGVYGTYKLTVKSLMFY